MPDVAQFSALPILQIFVGGITLIVSVWMMVQAQRDKRAVVQDKPIPDGQTMMLQGLASLREVVHALNNLCQILTAIDGQHRRTQDKLDKQTERINAQTDTHANLMRDMQSTAEAILNEMRRR